MSEGNGNNQSASVTLGDITTTDVADCQKAPRLDADALGERKQTEDCRAWAVRLAARWKRKRNQHK